jgi:hypothetical protein
MIEVECSVALIVENMIEVECSVATQYGHLQVQTPPHNFLFSVETEILCVKISADA